MSLVMSYTHIRSQNKKKYSTVLGINLPCVAFVFYIYGAAGRLVNCRATDSFQLYQEMESSFESLRSSFFFIQSGGISTPLKLTVVVGSTTSQDISNMRNKVVFS